MDVTEKLRRLTETHNISALAEKAGLGRGPVWQAVRGKAIPARATISALAFALNVDAGWLMDDSKDWPPVYLEHQNAVA